MDENRVDIGGQVLGSSKTHDLTPVPGRAECERGTSGTVDVEPPEPVIARGVGWLFNAVVRRLVFAWGALFFAVAVACLGVAWNLVSGAQQSLLAAMTERGTIRIIDSAVEIVPASGADMLMDPSRALSHHEYRLEHAVELSYLADRPARVYRSAPRPDLEGAAFWKVLGAEPVFRTERFTIKIDRKLHELLQKTPAPGGDISSFDMFWPPFDTPMHAMALEWLTASRDLPVPVRYDPAFPARFLFEKSYVAASEGASRAWSIGGGVLLGGFGLFILVFAVGMLTHGMHRCVPMALFFGTIAAVPFASGPLQAVVGYLGIGDVEESLIAELTTSMDPVARSGFLEEVPVERQADLVALTVDVPHSRYRGVFDFFSVTRPEGAFRSFDEAMSAISAQIAGQMVVMPADELFRFFKILDGHMEHNDEGWDGPLLEGTRELALNGTRSVALRSWAIDAFCDMSDAYEDPKTAESIYRLYVEAEADVKKFWRNSFWRFYLAPSFADDLRSADPERNRRALEIWAGRRMGTVDVRPFASSIKELTAHSDPQIRTMALEIWGSHTGWEKGKN